ncbi:hypothetical protein BDV12DRAFT_203200 [Aspergillus spectabilis]
MSGQVNQTETTSEPTSPRSDALVPAPNPTPPKREGHNIFTGEILKVGPSRYYHTELLAKTIHGTVVRIGFMFPDEDEDFERAPRELLRRGCMMLVLSADKVKMRGGGEGIEINNFRFIKLADTDELHRAVCQALREMDMERLIRDMWEELQEFRYVSLSPSSSLVAGSWIGWLGETIQKL